jgi:hypothetical protein
MVDVDEKVLWLLPFPVAVAVKSETWNVLYDRPYPNGYYRTSQRVVVSK